MANRVYTKTIMGVRYRRFKTYDNTRRMPGPQGPWEKVIYGRVHAQYYDKTNGVWVHVCHSEKPNREDVFGGYRGMPLPDKDAQVTCLNCLRHEELMMKLDGPLPELDYDTP